MNNEKEKQIFNPYLPSYEYIPDGEPHIFNGRVYLYGSHDHFNGPRFCMNDYICYSAPVDDLKSWRYEGVIYRKAQDPRVMKNGMHRTYDLFAPDVTQGSDGRYYLYYAFDFVGVISVAVCDTPAGQYEYYGDVCYPDGTLFGQKEHDNFAFDPGVMKDDDGRIWLHSGFSPLDPLYHDIKKVFGHESDQCGSEVLELEKDMRTVKSVKHMIPGIKNSKGTGFEGHEFFEASSIRKFDGMYYFIYSSVLGHELCYAYSKYPDRDFHFGGILHSNCDLNYHGNTRPLNYWGNNHGSLLKIKDKYYIFGHRQTNYHEFSRQAVAEEIRFENGRFLQAECTSQGLNGKPLRGTGIYEARIACNLLSKYGTFQSSWIPDKKVAPAFTQTGEDREDHPDQYITNLQDGCIVGFKYFSFENLTEVAVSVKGNAKGILSICTELDGNAIGLIALEPSQEYCWFAAKVLAQSVIKPLYFKFSGEGTFDFNLFALK